MLSQGVKVLSTARRVVVRCLVQEDPFHAEAFVVPGPSGVGVDLFVNLTQGFVAVADPDIAHRRHIGARIQLWYFAEVVMAGQSRTARSTVGVHYHQKVDVGMSGYPAWRQKALRYRRSRAKPYTS